MSNLWDKADSAVAPPQVYFGRVTFDPKEVVLEKGIGQRLFGPGDDEKRKTDAMWITLDPLPGSNLKPMDIKLTLFDQKWYGFLLPSYKALGLQAQNFAFPGRWIKYEWTPTGRKYTANGQEKEEKAIRILAVYSSQAECEQAARTELPATQFVQSPIGNGNGTPGLSPQVAQGFLTVFAQQAAGDQQAFVQKVLATEPLNRLYTAQSPELKTAFEAAGGLWF